MSEPALEKKPATYEDLCKVPDTKIAEILGGELIVSPRPAGRHTAVSSTAGSDIHGPFHRKSGDKRGPGGWIILYEPEVHLGGDIVVPDLAGWRRERMPVPYQTPFTSLAPDWVCEVISPRSVKNDRIVKPLIYAREKVGFMWLVEPRTKTLEVFRLEGAFWVRLAAFAGDETVRAPPFEVVELELERWWEGSIDETEGQ